ncbi:Hsp20/alpha crystallin family protein, partial [Acinetobacter baumannii]
KTSEQKQIYSPPVTIYENDESYVVFVALSGVDDKTVQVRVDKGILTIEASLNLELPDGATAKYTEVRLGDCRRSLNI